MCVDANAGARAAAKERAAQKDALFAQEGLKFFNKETQLARTQKRNVVGFSRDLSDAYASALAQQGKGRKTVEKTNSFEHSSRSLTAPFSRECLSFLYHGICHRI